MYYCACGYCGTGSSAIYHLLSEYEGMETGNLGDYEHVLMYTPHGVFDLEDVMYRNNGWHNFDAALDDFKREMKRLNDNDFSWFGGFEARHGDQFNKILKEFTDSITQYELDGSWSYDYQGFKIDGIQLAKDTIRKIQGYPREHLGRVLDRKPDKKIHYSFMPREEYLVHARKFVYDYLHMMYGDAELVDMNQFLLPQNLYRVPDYFGRDLKCAIVDRDPRDLYIITKYVWPIKGFVSRFPLNVEEFCTFFRGMRESVTPYDESLVIKINFEDLIYKYDETVAQVEQFFGLDPATHTKPKTHLDPAISINNTQNYLIKPGWAEEVKYIEKELPEYLYHFPYERQPKLEDTKFL
ncbi:MAG: hypothetical protein VZT48_07830 [Bulleidia sp.]|nr:hypothetical protein [Bulleidia sp.]